MIGAAPIKYNEKSLEVDDSVGNREEMAYEIEEPETETSVKNPIAQLH